MYFFLVTHTHFLTDFTFYNHVLLSIKRYPINECLWKAGPPVCPNDQDSNALIEEVATLFDQFLHLIGLTDLSDIVAERCLQRYIEWKLACVKLDSTEPKYERDNGKDGRSCCVR
jgi:hypothetical protein